MTELIEWLRAQLDEDERMANAAADGYPHWRADDDGDVSAEGTGGNGYLANGPWGGSLGDAGHHMARHDPARALAEVDAKRRLLDAYLPVGEDPHPGEPCINYADQDPADYTEYDSCCRHIAAMKRRFFAGGSGDYLIRVLALPYADRPGYREEWRP